MRGDCKRTAAYFVLSSHRQALSLTVEHPNRDENKYTRSAATASEGDQGGPRHPKSWTSSDKISQDVSRHVEDLSLIHI